MQVSSACTGKAYVFDTESAIKAKKYENKTDMTSKSFFQSPQKYHTDSIMDDIQEWKSFCQKQILANNIDYIA